MTLLNTIRSLDTKLRRAESSGGLVEWLIPFAFVFSAGWIIWHGPAYILDFMSHETPSLVAQLTELHKSKDITPHLPALLGGLTDPVDWLALLLVPLTFALGVRYMGIASMEFDTPHPIDALAMFVGRITMILIISMTLVMLYEVCLRYILEKPTLWANELTLWIAGFVFMLSGIYTMQQRTHIRIFILYDILPRWAQHICDVIWVILLWMFAFFLIFGSYKQVFVIKLYRWEVFGTAFDPPIPATIQPMILITICMIALQALVNLLADWNKDPAQLLEKGDMDDENLKAIKKTIGDR